MNIDPLMVEAAITPKTKAIIVVHLFGKVCDMRSISRIAERHGIAVVEDMAQSLGARLWGNMCGNLGDIAALSFYPTKNLGGIGEGGMVLTKRDDLAHRVRMLRVHGMDQVPYLHQLIGINSRLDEIKACALVEKLRIWRPGTRSASPMPRLTTGTSRNCLWCCPRWKVPGLMSFTST